MKKILLVLLTFPSLSLAAPAIDGISPSMSAGAVLYQQKSGARLISFTLEPAIKHNVSDDFDLGISAALSPISGGSPTRNGFALSSLLTTYFYPEDDVSLELSGGVMSWTDSMAKAGFIARGRITYDYFYADVAAFKSDSVRVGTVLIFSLGVQFQWKN